mmetsp:Transcript_8442/g.23713  ORF Transcript_8442/g.23713 Transcript_8442/m.23713 type:complete len:263 (-) Transcript_8442:942-1730(-)
MNLVGGAATRRATTSRAGSRPSWSGPRRPGTTQEPSWTIRWWTRCGRATAAWSPLRRLATTVAWRPVRTPRSWRRRGRAWRWRSRRSRRRGSEQRRPPRRRSRRRGAWRSSRPRPRCRSSRSRPCGRSWPRGSSTCSRSGSSGPRSGSTCTRGRRSGTPSAPPMTPRCESCRTTSDDARASWIITGHSYPHLRSSGSAGPLSGRSRSAPPRRGPPPASPPSCAKVPWARRRFSGASSPTAPSSRTRPPTCPSRCPAGRRRPW